MATHKRFSAENFIDVFRRLEEYGVDYVLCGGFACLLHGVSRVTNDLDICIRLTDDNVDSFVKAMASLNLQTRIPEPIEAFADPERRRVWREKKNALVLSLNAPDRLLQIDVFLDYPIGYDDLSSDAKQAELGSVPVRFSSKKHLIAAKERIQPPRPHDLIDLEQLRQLLEEESNDD
ncbi:MAG: nucleotidyl transferase AbiEii/AbiGii toxin family protein [Planctomycetota bacterium]